MSGFNFIQSVAYITIACLYLYAVYTDYWIYSTDRIYRFTGGMYHKNFGGRLKFLTWIDMVSWRLSELIFYLLISEFLFKLYYSRIFKLSISCFVPSTLYKVVLEGN